VPVESPTPVMHTINRFGHQVAKQLVIVRFVQQVVFLIVGFFLGGGFFFLWFSVRSFVMPTEFLHAR
jgi:hypothetical protein